MRSQYTDRSLVSTDHKIRQDMAQITYEAVTGLRRQDAVNCSHHSTRGIGVGKCKTVFTGRHYPRKITGVRNDVPGKSHGDILVV